MTIMAVGVSCALSLQVLYSLVHGSPGFDGTVYTWLVSDDIPMRVGFLIDRLSALMMAVVTFVSLCVHVYTIGYMHEDDGYQRFFAYISLFTFAMLMLVMANNFLQLFFGWEAVGVVSYLLIGFWYTRPSAIFANLKAFVVNRVGDFGFLLGIAGVWAVWHLVRRLVGRRAALLSSVVLATSTQWALVLSGVDFAVIFCDCSSGQTPKLPAPKCLQECTPVLSAAKAAQPMKISLPRVNYSYRASGLAHPG